MTLNLEKWHLVGRHLLPGPIPTPTTLAELQALLRQYPPGGYPPTNAPCSRSPRCSGIGPSIFRIRLIPALAQQLVDVEPDRFMAPGSAEKVANMIRTGEWDADVIQPMCLTAETLKMWTGGSRIRAVVLTGVAIDTRIARIPDLPWMGGGINPPLGPPGSPA